MQTHKQLEEMILSMPNAKLDYPFGAGTAVYKVGDKMFAIISEDSSPLRISLKCDPQLAVHLRERYESVMPGYHLNKKHWNTVLVDGSVSSKQLKQWIDHSYDLIAAGLPRKRKTSKK